MQKYEKGTNRMSASKLWDIANFLVVDIGYFFIGLPDDVSVGAEPDATALGRPTRASIEISRLAAKLTTEQQRLMVELITDMAH